MLKTDYDEIYGCTLEEYCKFHNTSIEELKEKTEKDIELLRSNLRKIIYDEERLLDPVTEAIQGLISKKRKHLSRLKDWERNSK